MPLRVAGRVCPGCGGCKVGHALSESRVIPRSARRRTSCNATVKFSVQRSVEFGDKLVVVGNDKCLGRWDLGNGIELKWNDGDVWKTEVKTPDSADLEFKLVVVKGQGEPEWEHGDNRKVKVNGSGVAVDMAWGNTENGSVVPLEGASASMDGGAPAEASTDGSSSESEAGSSDNLDRLPQNQWQGRQIEFMTENKHSKERLGKWDSSNLEGTLLHLVDGDRDAGSWLQKLEVAKGIVVDRSDNMRPSLEALAPLFIYLQWISTGAIQCVEGGGHFRPNRHAELSKIMFRSLEWVAGDNSKTESERLLARRMQGKLPSFGEEFTASVPLTRIRDIAHRNDIPHDLKREIKHTLQNKLHRNAGPEDLVATESMLERITAPGTDYSHGFVEEFKVFTDELRDFFNAASLAKILGAIEDALDDSGKSALNRFLSAKGDLDGKGTNASMNDVVDTMHQLTTVRSMIISGLASGLRNDAPDSALVMRQKWRLAELRCEDYAFVLLSRFLNMLDERGGADHLAGAHEQDWALPIGMLVLSVRNCGLSGFKARECHALDEELVAWQKLGLAQSREDTLRLRATLERCMRLADSFAENQLETFADPALKLGSALGIPNEVQTVFTESEIRANVVFQLSKLATALLRAARTSLGASDFDAIVMGEAVGVLARVRCIEPGMKAADGKPCVLLVDEASGDEEITTAGDNIQGVILCQDLPHLSHLGVRARQEKVPFVTCTSADIVDNTITPLMGNPVRLSATASNVSVSQTDMAAIEADTGASGSSSGNGVAAAVDRAEAKRVSQPKVVPLADATLETCGSKATSCGKLSQLAAASGDDGARFLALPGAVLPFGCMEAAVKAAGKQGDLDRLMQAIDSAAVGPELDKLCTEAHDLLTSSEMQNAARSSVIGDLQKALGDADVVIARSSANVEDLAGLSAAGLYESIPNLTTSDAASLAFGVTKVWASLFSRRAVLSRRAAGIPQGEACMAVLVQEMKAPELSFVLHTADPIAEDASSSVYAEVAPGLGETLASGAEGSAWRASIARSGGTVTTHSFANFSSAYLPVTSKPSNSAGPGMSIYGSVDASTDDGDSRVGMVKPAVVDYSAQRLSTSHDDRQALMAKLGSIGARLEKELGGPQDVEGAVVGEDVFVVQSRPQP